MENYEVFETDAICSPEQIQAAEERLRPGERSLVFDTNVLLNYCQMTALDRIEKARWPLQARVLNSGALTEAMKVRFYALSDSEGDGDGSAGTPAVVVPEGVYSEVWSVAYSKWLVDYVGHRQVVEWWTSRRANEGNDLTIEDDTETRQLPALVAQSLKLVGLDCIREVRESEWFDVEPDRYDESRTAHAKRAYESAIEVLRARGELNEYLASKRAGGVKASDVDLRLMLFASDMQLRFASCDTDLADEGLNRELREAGVSSEVLDASPRSMRVPFLGRKQLRGMNEQPDAPWVTRRQPGEVATCIVCTAADSKQGRLRVLLDSGQRAHLYVDGRVHRATEALDGVRPDDMRYAPGQEIRVVVVGTQGPGGALKVALVDSATEGGNTVVS